MLTRMKKIILFKIVSNLISKQSLKDLKMIFLEKAQEKDYIILKIYLFITSLFEIITVYLLVEFGTIGTKIT